MMVQLKAIVATTADALLIKSSTIQLLLRTSSNQRNTLFLKEKYDITGDKL